MQGASRDSLAAARERLDTLARSTDTDLIRVADELHAVVLLLDRTVTLRRALTDPSRSGEARAALIERLLTGQVGGAAADLLGGIARSRWSRPRDLADAIDELSVDAELAQAERDGALDDLEDELFRFGRIVAGQPQLRVALSEPRADGARRAALIGELLDGKVRPVSQRLILRQVQHPRGSRIEAGLEHLQRLAAERRRRMVALVKAAVPLTEEQRERLAAALGRIYGRQVHLNVEIDDEIIGGVRVHVGDDVIDGSVATKLHEARRRLAG